MRQLERSEIKIGRGYSRTVFPDQGIVVDMVVDCYEVTKQTDFQDFFTKRLVINEQATGKCSGTVVAIYQIGDEPQVDDLKRHYEQIQGERLALTGTVQVDGEIIDG